MTVLAALRAELASATNQLLATAASLSDADVRAPSRLPGWTRGHVLAHLAANADSYVSLLAWARTGVRTPQYSSYESRAAAIEAHALQPAAQHLARLEDGAARFAAAVRNLPDRAWSARVEGLRPPPHPAWYVLVRRLREVGFHHVDLAAGYGPADWPDPFVRRELHDCHTTWPHDHSTVSEIILLTPPPPPPPHPATPITHRPPPTHPGTPATPAVTPVTDGPSQPPLMRPMTPAAPVIHQSSPGSPPVTTHRPLEIVARWRGLGDGPAVAGTPRDMLAWLTGRSRGEGVSLLPVGQSFMPGPGGAGLPPPPPWLTMPAPADLPATPPKDYP
ncbi:maleylpyruvate isomerase N-terminal domain-containing protein [Nonomuraea sp. NPDC048882]|uniref:maleylpyruvate isomerase N-terminal domain-containing protein n=1 Tax=Nonomuraea sp. NPDC048882 TaxID=3154347 RepID=UPI0033F3B363